MAWAVFKSLNFLFWRSRSFHSSSSPTCFQRENNSRTQIGKRLKGGSHYAVNLLWPAIASCCKILEKILVATHCATANLQRLGSLNRPILEQNQAETNTTKTYRPLCFTFVAINISRNRYLKTIPSLFRDFCSYQNLHQRLGSAEIC